MTTQIISCYVSLVPESDGSEPKINFVDGEEIPDNSKLFCQMISTSNPGDETGSVKFVFPPDVPSEFRKVIRDLIDEKFGDQGYSIYRGE